MKPQKFTRTIETEGIKMPNDIEGKKADIFEAHDLLFYTYYDKDSNLWHLVEGATGMSISNSMFSSIDAVNKGRVIIKKAKSKGKFFSRLFEEAELLKEHGISTPLNKVKTPEKAVSY